MTHLTEEQKSRAVLLLGERSDEFVKEYESGWSKRWLAHRFGVSAQVIRSILS